MVKISIGDNATVGDGDGTDARKLILAAGSGATITTTKYPGSGTVTATIGATGSGGGSPWFGQFFVDGHNGNDSNDGITWATAKKTINSILTGEGGSLVIYLAPGTYTETVSLANKPGVRIFGISNSTSGTYGATIQAPDDTSSALTWYGGEGTNTEVAYVNLVGNPSGTYTGTVVQTGGNSMYIHDCTISGNTSESVIKAGTYGGIGLHVQGTDLGVFERITIGNCHIGLGEAMTDGEGECANCRFSDFFFSDCYKAWVQTTPTFSSNVCTGNVYQRFKGYGNGDGVVTADGNITELYGTGNTYISIDGTVEQPAASQATWLIGGNQNYFLNCTNAGGVALKVTGNDNEFHGWWPQDSFTIASGALRTKLKLSSITTGYPWATVADSGTWTEYWGFTNLGSYGTNPIIDGQIFMSSIPSGDSHYQPYGWIAGQVVYSTDPASLGFTGWICTVAGTPGTWKTFGAVTS